jgi:hypothetical protein
LVPVLPFVGSAAMLTVIQAPISWAPLIAFIFTNRSILVFLQGFTYNPDSCNLTEQVWDY